jgi:hypothetical protein
VVAFYESSETRWIRGRGFARGRLRSRHRGVGPRPGSGQAHERRCRTPLQLPPPSPQLSTEGHPPSSPICGRTLTDGRARSSRRQLSQYAASFPFVSTGSVGFRMLRKKLKFADAKCVILNRSTTINISANRNMIVKYSLPTFLWHLQVCQQFFLRLQL